VCAVAVGALTVRRPAVAQNGVLPSDERLQFANGLYARGMYELASKEYESYLEEVGDGGKADTAWFRLGECYKNCSQLREAERAFRTVLTKFPESEYRQRAGFRRADIFLGMGHHAAAIDLFDTVLEQEPPKDLAAAATYLQGTAYLKDDQVAEAVTRFQTVVDKYADSRFLQYALLELGGIYGDAENEPADVGKALDLYHKVAAKPESDRVGAEAWFQIADLHFRQKAYDRSSEAYGNLLTKYPKDRRAEEAVLQAAWAAHNAGLFAEGLARATAALAQLAQAEAATEGEAANESRAEWIYLKANCERQVMKYQEAITTYAELLAGFPGSRYEQAARYEKALVYYKVGQFKQAIAEARQVRAEGELGKDVYWLLAESHASLKETPSAVQYYRLICRDFPKSDVACDATYRLAHHLRVQGDHKEAANWYHTVAHDFPDNELAPKALFASALCLLKEGMNAEAVRDWTNLITKHPKHPLVEESMYQRAMGEMRLRRDEDALKTLRELLRQFPTTRFKAEAHYWMGILFKETEKFADAERELREALANKPKEELARKAEFFLGVVLQNNGKEADAADYFQRLLDSPMTDKFTPALLEWLALYRFDNKKYAEASAAADLLIKTAADEEWLQIGWGLKGRSLAALGKPDDASAAFRKALASSASTRYAPESALRLADVMYESTRYTEARELYEKAAALSADATLLGIRARAYYGLARTAEATEDLERAVRFYMSVAVLYDDDELVPGCLERAAAGFAKLGKNDQQQAILAELVERYPESEQAKRARAKP